MNNAQALEWGQRLLQEKDISTARLDALVLLEDNTKSDRAHILAQPAELLNIEAVKNYRRQIKQRAKHLPLAYIRGKTEFYGREFLINKQVLEPRPESEAVIDELKALNLAQNTKLVDIGTGSGALIITAKLELPQIEAYASDISAACLVLAQKNAKRYKTTVNFQIADMVRPLPTKIWSNKTVVMANLPYVPDGWQINPPAMREPKIAIFGGKDGLKLYLRLFKELKTLTEPPEWVLTEALPPQHEALLNIAAKNGYKLIKSNDFIQVFKTTSHQGLH